MYDIIGDIHGYAHSLAALLKKLGYEKKFGVYSHPERKAIYVGDFIDRGPDSRTVLHIVRNMVEAEQALAVAGNHEYNALLLHTIGHDGQPLREHSTKNLWQTQATADSFRQHQGDWLSYLSWMKTLPLLLELDEGIRIVHASWQKLTVQQLNARWGKKALSSDEFLKESKLSGSWARIIVGDCLVGHEIELPGDLSFRDTDGHLRKDMRIKWWENPEGKTLKDIGLSGEFPDIAIPESWYDKWPFYGESEMPVFFGHYWMKGKPAPQRNNVCCLDYSVADGGILAAYQWNGEKVLAAKNIQW